MDVYKGFVNIFVVMVKHRNLYILLQHILISNPLLGSTVSKIVS